MGIDCTVYNCTAMVFFMLLEKIMKKILLMFLMLQLFNLQSQAADWPGTGTCSTTLQACINSVSDGGTINVVTDTPISAGTFTIDKGLTLQAGSGFHPQFSNITLVIIAPPVGKKVTIQGFEFHGFAYISAKLTINNEINIKNNKWLDPDMGADRFEGVQVKVSAALTTGNSATFNFIANDLHGAGSNSAFGFIDIFNNQAGTLKANLIDNHIDIANAGSINPAIFLTNAGSGQLDVKVIANNLKAQGDFLVFQQGNISGLAKMNLGVVSNVFTGGRQFGSSVAVNNLIKSEVNQGIFNGVFGNNTLDGGGGTSKGFNFLNHTTNLSSNINILNNIVVNTSKAVESPISGSSSTITSGGFNIFSPGSIFVIFALQPSDLLVDPQFVQPGVNYALQATSPAIDKISILGSDILYQNGVLMGSPRIDADGLRRYKGVKLDSGAVEWGDRHILHQAISPFANVSVTSDTPFNSDTNAVPIVTQVWNYENLSGTYNDHPIGVYRNFSWGVINEDNTSIPVNSKYHFFYPYGQDYGGTNLNGLIRWTHTSTMVTGFELDDPSLLDNNAKAGVFLSNFWDGPNSPVYNPHSLEVGYQVLNGKWFLANSDEVNMPTNAKFFTYNQDYSRNVFNHKVTMANTQGNVTVIDHPLLNGNSCSLPTVTQVAPLVLFGPAFGNNPHHIGVFYSAPLAKWAIFNQDIVNFDTSALGAASFNVMVDPQQVYVCNTKILFADGFE